MRIKKYLLTVFIVLIGLTSSLYAKSIPQTGTDGLQFTDLNNGGSMGYSVGLMYYEIWRRSDGVSWTSDGKPGGTYTAEYTYKFKFKEKVDSVNVSKFQPSNSVQMGVWDEVREDTNYDDEIRAAVGQIVSVSYTTSGLGTNSISVHVKASVTLNASNPVNVTKPWQDELVQGLKYYVPVFIKVTFKENLTYVGSYAAASGNVDRVVQNGDIFYITFGPYKKETAIYVYRQPNWIQLVGNLTKQKSTTPTEIIRLAAGEKVDKAYAYDGGYSGYDNTANGLAYAVYQ